MSKKNIKKDEDVIARSTSDEAISSERNGILIPKYEIASPSVAMTGRCIFKWPT